jgi:cytochrome P450
LESLDLVATATGWALVHLALNPEKQEYLFYELWPRTLQANGHITNETIKSSPYLSAVVNESDRWTPTSSAFEVMNYGTGVGGDVYEFNTEQWLESRMPRLDVSEIVDQSFKQTGACNTLGSALAEQQMKTILAHLVLDWKMYGPPSLGSFDDVKAKTVSNQLRPVMPTLQFVARSR